MTAPSSAPRATPGTYLGLFLVTLATLMYEVLLTRIFSVTMWYHFAFVAISIAMFGMTLGALLIYLLPGFFTPSRTKRHLGLSALWTSVTIVLSFLTHLSIPFAPSRSITSLYSIAFNYAVISIPFIFSGVCVCLALTRFPAQVSRLYAADLAGAALGCILLIAALRITDGPTAVILVAALAGLGAVLFLRDEPAGRLRRTAALVTGLLVIFAIGQTVLVHQQRSLLRLMWVKNFLEQRPEYEKWNSFSRVAVWRDWPGYDKPFGWGIKRLPADRKAEQLLLNIDAGASTVLTRFDGSLDKVDYLRNDITNLAHYVKPDSSVLVIGTGGGRDILSALVFQQPQVLGIEINDIIIDALNRRYGDFTGHLDRRPGVRFVNDEARSYVTRSPERFDIIQVSLIDTWAATTAGAFVLSENSLYTTDAWKIFFDHLTPGGLLTFSRWYFLQSPAEMYRLTALATTCLKQQGVSDPRSHLFIARCMQEPSGGMQPDGVGTLLLSRDPFTSEQLDVLETTSRRLGFEVVLSPRASLDPTFEKIASGTDLASFTASYPLNISPPTDNNPFFFHMLRLGSLLRHGFDEQGGASFNLRAVLVLGMLLTIVTVLTVMGIVVPLLLTMKRVSLSGAGPLLLYFCSIGCGFMLIEVSQMQRLIVFLGHPTFGLSVVLFSLLVSSSLGAYLTGRVEGGGWSRASMACLIGLTGVLVLFGLTTTGVIHAAQGLTTAARIVVATGMLFPIGLLMGTAFPLGMKLAGARAAALTPWLWGVNGGTSVFASVLAAAIALSFGISAAYWTGVGAYLVALATFAWAGRGARASLDGG